MLYLDTDTIAIQPLDDLYHKAFDGASYIACTHVRALFNKMNCLRLGIAEDVPYINTGVMVLNLKQLRQQQTTEDVLAFVSDKKTACSCRIRTSSLLCTASRFSWRTAIATI